MGSKEETTWVGFLKLCGLIFQQHYTEAGSTFKLPRVQTHTLATNQQAKWIFCTTTMFIAKYITLRFCWVKKKIPTSFDSLKLSWFKKPWGGWNGKGQGQGQTWRLLRGECERDVQNVTHLHGQNVQWQLMHKSPIQNSCGGRCVTAV